MQGVRSGDDNRSRACSAESRGSQTDFITSGRKARDPAGIRRRQTGRRDNAPEASRRSERRKARGAENGARSRSASRAIDGQ
jgi:hypothetical protein